MLERSDFVGGNAASFELSGVHVDFGSHRLHPGSDPEILSDIKKLLGDDLRDRPRHGRIRLQGRWIHFPLRPVDLLLHLRPTFALGIGMDVAGRLLRLAPANSQEENFATVLENGLGKTICRDFYFPYARKLWGVEPESLSAVQARRRVSAATLSQMTRKALSAVPGLGTPDSGRFYYPIGGFGQISRAYAQAAHDAGAEIRLGATVTSVKMRSGNPHEVQYRQGERVETLLADYVWSTMPITVLARLLNPAPPPKYLQAAANIDYRAMILIYLVLAQDRFSEFDAHYFPETDILISRLSEPKNYSKVSEPADRTVLCAELPCSTDDDVWHKSDEGLGELVQEALAIAGIPVRSQILKVTTRRLRQAYPVYAKGYEAHFDRLDKWIGQVDGLLTFGRQGLFAHDNTHHALYMAYAAASCLDTAGQFNRDRWLEYREVFKTHVVED